jgi:hypothetical protein
MSFVKKTDFDYAQSDCHPERIPITMGRRVFNANILVLGVLTK